jgi:hypothetical protein
MPREQADKVGSEGIRFSFSKEQWDELKRILGKYETGTGKGFASNVNQFIIELESACSAAKMMLSWEEYRDNQANIDDLSKHLRKALKILNPSAIDSSGKLKNAGARPFPISSYPQTYYYETETPTLAEILPKEQEFWKRANTATLAIMNLLAILDDSKRFTERKRRLKGQLPADHDRFARSIAGAFQRHFAEKPTGHKDGAFAEVIRIAFQALGRHWQHPDRTIRAALKNLKIK